MLLSLYTLFTIVFANNKFEHLIPGCPHGSECTKEMGQYLLKFESSYKKKKELSYLTKNGIPFEVWFMSENINKPKALWDNHCSPGKNHTIGILIVKKSLKNLLSNKNNVTRRAIFRDSPNKYTTYHMPRTHLPLHMSGQKLIFQKSFNSMYYNFSLDLNHKIRVIKSSMPQKSPETVTCPQDLVNKFTFDKREKEIFKGKMCQKIWNKKSKRYQTFITSWDCH